MNINTIFTFIIGITFMMFGYEVYKSPIVHIRKYGQLNFGEYHSLLGIIFIVFGLAMLAILMLALLKSIRENMKKR